jgi:hypothetical protein
MAASLAAAYCSARPVPNFAHRLSYFSPCWEVSFAVVLPEVPAATRSASTTATSSPASWRFSAAVSPVMPPPTTATSTRRSPSRGS